MIFIAVIVWIFAHLLFWYPDHIDFQLIFALSSGLQVIAFLYLCLVKYHVEMPLNYYNRPFSYSTKEPGSSDIFIQFYVQGSIEWR